MIQWRSPLTWPDNRARTPFRDRVRSAFRSKRERGFVERVSLTVAADRLEAQVRLMREVTAVVLSSDVKLRKDGSGPLSSDGLPVDSAAALYFSLRGRPIVLACDRFDELPGNMVAIAYHIEALRGQERWGVGSIDQAFMGYQALPPPSAAAQQGWRVVLDSPSTLEEAEKVYRAKMRRAHPDAGGSHAAAAALNAAIKLARLELS